MKKRFTYCFEFFDGRWSFFCVYADNREEADSLFWRNRPFSDEFILLQKVEEN